MTADQIDSHTRRDRFEIVPLGMGSSTADSSSVSSTGLGTYPRRPLLQLQEAHVEGRVVGYQHRVLAKLAERGSTCRSVGCREHARRSR